MRTRKIFALIALLAIALATGCNTVKKNSTPTEAFKAYYDAVKKEDVAAVKKTLSKNLLNPLEELAKRRNKPLDEVLFGYIQGAKKYLPDTLEVRNEKIDGDHATLEYKSHDETLGDSWKTHNFVKEDGEWKLDVGYR